MEANITEQQHSGDLLAEPHFDEEATILSARPVVPLHEIKAAERSNKRLTFALALVAALVIGALGATLIYRQRVRTAETATIETAVPDTKESSESNGAAAGPTVSDAGGGRSETPAPAVSASAASANVSDALPSDPRDSAATRPRKPSTVVVQSSAKSPEPWRDEVKNDEVSNIDEIRAQRRAERQEARRQRREAQREAGGEVRSRRVQRSDDLLRIREIFEGPRRRPRFQRWQ